MPTDPPSARSTARPEIPCNAGFARVAKPIRRASFGGASVIFAAAAIVLTLGLLIVSLRGAYLLGWLPVSSWTTPVPAVGVAFILCGVILLAQAWQRKTLLRVASVALLAIVGARLVHRTFEWWIDAHPWLDAALAFFHTGMAHRSAEMFLVIATGLIAYDPPWRSRARAPIVAALASLLAVICIVQLSVSMTDTGLTYGWEYFTFLSPHVVIGFFTLACALFARAWADDQQRRPAGPSWIPIPIAAVLICATFMLWHALRVEEWGHLQDQTRAETVELKEALTEATRQHMHAMVRVASRWQHGGYDTREMWEADTRLLLAHYPGLHAVAFAGPDLSLRWITANGHVDQIRALEGYNLLSERHRAIAAKAAKATRRPIVSKPIKLWDNGALGFLIMCPVYRDDGTFEGVVVGALRASEVFTPLLYGRTYSLEIKDGPTTLYRTTGAPGRIVNTLSVSLDGTSWTITAWPSPALLYQLESTFPIIVLGAGLLTSLLVALMVGFAQTAAQRAEEARRAKLVTEQHSRRMHIQSQQLAQARDAAINATSAKSQFLATMSQEIRTPMNGVLGTLSLLQDTPLSNEQREYVGQVQTSADTLMRIIDDILDFSKAEAGRLTIEEAEIDLRALVEDAADLMAASAQRKGLEFAVYVEPDVPNQLRGDSVRLRQVLLNLLSNAIKFTSAGAITLTVSRDITSPATTPGAAEGVMLRFTVTDTGIGISSIALGRLFEPFSQADSSTTRRYGGSGLGLAIARQIAELMGGSAGASSEEGRGSTFWITARLEQGTPTVTTPALPGVRVLLADDQPVSLAGLREQLLELGATVETAATAAEVRELLGAAPAAETAFQVVMIDESIVLDGSTPAGPVAIDLRALAPGAVALLTTVRSRSSATERATSLGFHGFVAKPTRRRHLEAVLLSTLGRQTGQPERRGSRPERAEWPAEGWPAGRGVRILVAEDNEINQKVIARMLKKLGHEVDVVINGLEAVEACARGGYDVVLMDCQMPEMDGYAATGRIRQQPGRLGRVPIIALTADASAADRDRCLAAGMDDFLGKPVRPRELAVTIQRWTPVPADDPQAIEHPHA
jgi:signal transduction histidine kinase/DNA-binding response OmpR family regulator